jgi:hypothetical protein
MNGSGGCWGKTLAAVLLAQAWGCSPVDGPPDGSGDTGAPSSAPEAQAPGVPAVPEPPLAPEEPTPPDTGSAPLSCEDILPGPLGPSQNITINVNAGDYADCGTGTSNGAGYLALRNSGRSGSTAWSVVSPEGLYTGKTLFGGDLTDTIVPQPRGFYVSFVAISPAGLALKPYREDGTPLSPVRLTNDYNSPVSLAPDPQGGAMYAAWSPQEGNTQALIYQFRDAEGAARAEPAALLTLPAANGPLLTGVDTLGRGLVMWRTPGDSNGWSAQWVTRHGTSLTPPFQFMLPQVGYGSLHPLVGGGLALRDGNARWLAQFPSGQADVQHAPAWLANHPGTRLVLVRGQQAHALIPRGAETASGGCQPSVLLFTQDGTACGAVQIPELPGACNGREINVGVDGTAVQYLETIIPPDVCDEDDICVPSTEKPRCSWRWWPGLLQ